MIAAVTVAARVVGFARIVTFARTVGPTCLGDVYTTANTIPNIVFDVVAGGALSGLVIPVLAGRIAVDRHDEVRQITGALLGWILLLLVPLSVVGGLLAHPLMGLLIGAGHAGCNRAVEVGLGARMLVVFAPQIALYGVGIVLAGTLQAYRRFFWPALAPLLSSVVVIATYLVFRAVGSGDALSTHLQLDTAILAGGTTVGVVALALPLLVPALRASKLRLGLRLPPGVAPTVLRLAAAGAAVLASQQLATAVVLRLANAYGDAGSVVAWNIGWTVFLLPWAILAVPVATSAFPALSAAWHEGDRGRYDATVARTTRTVVVLTFVAAAVMAALAAPGARVLIAGAPGRLAPAVLSRTVVGFAVGLPAYGLIAHLSRVRFARGDARWPALATAGGWAAGVLAVVLAVPRVPGGWVPAALAAGASGGLWLAAAALAAVVLADSPAAAAIARSAASGLLAAAAAAAAGLLISRLVPGGGPLDALGAVAAGAVAAVAVAGGVLLACERDLLRRPAVAQRS
jgi:putative peptidoglycan lipid II flippase